MSRRRRARPASRCWSSPSRRSPRTSTRRSGRRRSSVRSSSTSYRPRTRSGRLADGDEIPESRTTPPIEVETILEKGVPVLEAVDPEAFGASLHALAVGGRPATRSDIRRANVQSAKLLTETERTLPNLERNLVHLKNFAVGAERDGHRPAQSAGRPHRGRRSDPRTSRRRSSRRSRTSSRSRATSATSSRRASPTSATSPASGAAVLKVVADRADKLPGLVSVLDKFLAVWVKDLHARPPLAHLRDRPADRPGRPVRPR